MNVYSYTDEMHEQTTYCSTKSEAVMLWRDHGYKGVVDRHVVTTEGGIRATAARLLNGWSWCLETKRVKGRWSWE